MRRHKNLVPGGNDEARRIVAEIAMAPQVLGKDQLDIS